jgi:3-hydroxyacyl-CoA dehydrogenase/enoyl-CoA hydratase/3-hydroxybutyryl-CoA epimerase
VACLREGVAGDAQLPDAGMVFGTGFAPLRGGPVQYIDAIGAAELLKSHSQEVRLRGARFTPDPGWEGLITTTDGNP